MMIGELLDYCRKYKEIYIYGAGMYGRVVCAYLEENGIRISGFIVSNLNHIDNKVLGHSVCDYNTIIDNGLNDCGIIVSLREEASCDIESILKSNNIYDYYKVSKQNDIDEIISCLKFKLRYDSENKIMCLVYHRVGDIGLDSRKLSMPSDLFEKQLLYIKNKYDILRSNEDWGRVSKDSVVITFDDGYCDFYSEILPILEKHQIPATIFISTGNIDSYKELWGDVLERLVFYSNVSEFEFEGCHYDVSTNEAKLTSMFLLRDILKNCTKIERDKKIKLLLKAVKIQDNPRMTHRTMNTNEILECSKSPWVTIGAHTISHCCLSSEDNNDQYNEMKGSKDKLEEIIGKEVSVFAYPYGQISDFTNDTIDLAEKIGFKKIFAAYGGLTSPEFINGRIPRNSISSCKTIDETIERMSMLKIIYGDSYI